MAGQAIARHLVFVLEDGTVVVQRGANLVEVLETREQRVFNSFDHHHNITDRELLALYESKQVLNFDDVTVWLADVKQEVGKARYYFLDTKLSTPYLKIVQSLLDTTDLRQRYTAKVHSQQVAILGLGGEPFTSLNDAEAALMLLKQALGKQLVGLSIQHLSIDTSIYDTQITAPVWQRDLSGGSLSNLADSIVLIVESDDEQARQLESALENLPMEVRIAATGENALEIIMDEEPDVVLLGMSLSDMHAYEVIAKIRKDPMTAQIPVVALSDHASQTDMFFALYVAKVDEYLVRPVELRIIRQRVLNLLNR